MQAKYLGLRLWQMDGPWAARSLAAFQYKNAYGTLPDKWDWAAQSLDIAVPDPLYPASSHLKDTARSSEEPSPPAPDTQLPPLHAHSAPFCLSDKLQMPLTPLRNLSPFMVEDHPSPSGGVHGVEITPSEPANWESEGGSLDFNPKQTTAPAAVEPSPDGSGWGKGYYSSPSKGKSSPSPDGGKRSGPPWAYKSSPSPDGGKRSGPPWEYGKSSKEK